MADHLDWLFQPFAHRGLHELRKGIIENTSSAFQAAIDAGYGIELDVRPTSDGEIVVFHDSTLDRLTETSGDVIEHSCAQLKRIRYRDTNDRIQTLSQMLEQTAGRVPLLIEIKTEWANQGPAERRVAKILEGYKGQAAVMSFDPKSMAAMAAIAPQIPRGIVAERFLGDHAVRSLSAWQRFYMRHLLSALIAKPQFVNYDIRALPAVAPWVWRNVLRRPLLVWTVRSKADQERAMRWADAIVFEQFRA